ncbi:MAG: lycopene cyclase [Sphingomonas bacterium]|nr:lycopene beta-cyclase CrtY [Sphingomonas bacterium]MDB5690251.1 lycopene cyclase [Sphingomonas bacterium]
MAQTIRCDVAIAGGGLAGGLIALALAARRPDVSVTIVEEGETLGGNHIWSFFDSDVVPQDRWLIDPLVAHGWQGYNVLFPSRRRRLPQSYASVHSELLDKAVRAALPPDRVLTGCRILGAGPAALVLEGGMRIEARGVIDARGAADLSLLDLGWQKFVGRVVQLTAPHRLERPVVMDATVEQIDGYRFVYLLPMGADTLLIEDTYYSDGPELDREAIAARIAAYAAQRGWTIKAVLREESGVLPVALGGDFEGYWRSGGNRVAKAGVRAGLFHPTTGYSLPDAIRTAILVAGLPDLAAPALHDALHRHARSAWASRGFYRLLDKMLFRAARPMERIKVFERFYGLDAGLIARFYAAQSTMFDRMRILAGKPPVPIGRAIAAIRENAR